MTMIRSNSPAMSEISVGSPSPPLHRPQHLDSASKNSTSNGFQYVPIIKKLKPREDFTIPLPQRRKSSNERIKSFSIADILGKKDETTKQNSEALTPPTVVGPPIMTVPPLIPTISPVATHAQLPIVGAGSLLMLDLPGLHKVVPTYGDPSHLSVIPNANSPTLPIHPFFPPALLHYEQRLAWDYQRQLQEHFHAQAQLLRQMSMDPNIIPSEDGSERGGSHDSSSGGSQCASPELHVESEDEDEDDAEADGDDSPANGSRENGSSIKKIIKGTSDTPLDALFQLSTKNFDEDQDPATLNIFATRPNPKKKRKSRTAFTNHQIFELEKRFLYQKYLSPADRDEIAAGLGLSNAQVITWFQNRRAKLKRDMEELKKDVESVKQLSAHKSFLENVNDLSILKTRPVSRHQYQPTSVMPAAAAAHTEVSYTAAITHGIPGTSTGATAVAATAGRPTTIPQPTLPNHHNHHHHQLQPHTNTCNETRESSHIRVVLNSEGNSNSTKVNHISTQSHTESSESQDDIVSLQHRQQQQQQQSSSHQYQQSARNLQISTSRG